MGKGDDRRPTQVDGATLDERWRQTFGSTRGTLGREPVRCSVCGRDVADYVRVHGERWCPWCSVKLEDGQAVKE